jgi:polyvinyl alcohol dehydrogenase (cytochrome)
MMKNKMGLAVYLALFWSLCASLLSARTTEDSPAAIASSLMPGNSPGEALFVSHCAVCHEGTVPKAPDRSILKIMAPTLIVDALTEGVMKKQASDLNSLQRRQIAEYLTGKDLKSFKLPRAPRMCQGEAKNFDLLQSPAKVGWGYDSRRFIPASVAGLSARDVARLKLNWAVAFPAAIVARSQPVAALGALFVGSQDGTVFALDLKTGCARWTTKVDAEVRTAVVIDTWEPGVRPKQTPRAYFGDILGQVYALNALTGDIVWKTRPDDSPSATITATPSLLEQTLYVAMSSLETIGASDPSYPCCSFRGSLFALDAETGKPRWRHYTIDSPPIERSKSQIGTPILAPSGAAIWGSPTVDLKRGVIYFGSSDNYSSPADENSDALFAVDLLTGKLRWRTQMLPGDAWNLACFIKGNPNCPQQAGQDYDIAASPMLINLDSGEQVVVAGQKSGAVWGVNPDQNGRPIWKIQLGRGSNLGGVHFGMAAEGSRVYVPIYDSKYKNDGTYYTEAGSPGLYAVDARNGNILWHNVAEGRCNGLSSNCESGISAAVTAIPGVVFAGHVDGWLRAYDGMTGKVIWEVDTKIRTNGVNGEVVQGGSMSGPGPAIIDGRVIVNSGYGQAFKMPGNALLAYTVNGK